ncbi:MAG: hypothetical protein FWB91_14625 [Defluviitaleaceae bacterium]|nr:hypothetical protein [Defluviitaleaceae bacterium]
MIDFRKKLDTVKDFVETNYHKYLEAFDVKKAPFITCEFLDFDKFKNDFTLFIDFDRISLSEDRYEDDCVHIARVSCDVYLVFRNAAVETLRANMMDATSALYEMFRCERIDIAHNINIDGVGFFHYVEGNKNLVSSKTPVTLDIGF